MLAENSPVGFPVTLMHRQCLPIMVLASSREASLLSAGRCLGPELRTEELLRLPQPGERTVRADFLRPQPLLHGWMMARVPGRQRENPSRSSVSSE
jgi:hypothetical protein